MITIRGQAVKNNNSAAWTSLGHLAIPADQLTSRFVNQHLMVICALIAESQEQQSGKRVRVVAMSNDAIVVDIDSLSAKMILS